jgi:hypothetical protein
MSAGAPRSPRRRSRCRQWRCSSRVIAPDSALNTYKLEGLAILNPNQVAIINDNDFGIDPAVQAGLPTRLWKLRLAIPLPLGK